LLAAAGVIAMTSGLIVMAVASPAQAADREGDVRYDNVAICHATGTDKWVYNGPGGGGVVAGHWGDGHQAGRDVIPAFAYQEFDGTRWVDVFFRGQNQDDVDFIGEGGCNARTGVDFVPPQEVLPGCGVAGSFVGVAQPAGVTQSVERSGLVYTFTYTLNNTISTTTFKWADGSTAPRTLILTAGAAIATQSTDPEAPCYSANARQVALVPPREVGPDCGVTGSFTRMAQPTGVTESVVQSSSNPLVYTFTYTLTNATFKWTDDSTAPKTLTVTLGAAIPAQTTNPNAPCYSANPPQVALVSPLVSDPGCGVDGSLAVRQQVPGIIQTQSPAGTGPGSYSFTYTLVQGYEFTDGTTAPKVVPVSVLTALTDQSTDEDGDCFVPAPAGSLDVCPNLTGNQSEIPVNRVKNGAGNCVIPAEVAGTETASPKPDKAPVVKGVEAVPTAVAAGLGDGPTMTGSSPIDLLAQMLVGGGLVLLMAAGWLQIGRRTHGVHQA